MGQTSLFQPDPPPERPPAGFTAYVQVALERGIDDGEGYTYGVSGDAPPIGTRVLVPLGKSGKNVGGVVVRRGGSELLGSISASRVRGIVRIEPARMPERLVELGRWLSEYYVAPLGMTLATMTPAAVKKLTGLKQDVLWERAASETFASIRATLPRALAKRADALGSLDASVFPCPTKALAELLGVRTSGAIVRLAEAGLLTRVTRDAIRSAALPGGDAEAASRAALPPGFTLSADQDRVIKSILPALGTFGVHVLRGVTGSGKTEVYLRLVAEALRVGQTAIVLVPEIALTPQTSERFTSRFGASRVAVLHSGLSGSQRHAAWARAASGGARLVVGARSAVFSPVENLGLIVVDEEHDGSYKQDQVPRYHARDVAVKRAQIEGCPVILGSATPSLESWSRTREGAAPRWHLHELRTRVGGAAFPLVRVVDLGEERRLRARDPLGDHRSLHLLGPTLEHAMEQHLRAGSQVMLLLNRRGFAHALSCPSPSCGYVVMCDQCDARLVLHRPRRAGELVRCHHCLTEQRVPALCAQCGRKLTTLGAGTQRLEDEVRRKFAALGVTSDGESPTMLRVDSDTMRTAKDYFSALSRFGAGDVRVLLGTQMIAKGLDFPGVRLVGVIDADTALSLPDFRAQERTFQLVSQVAGRSGRGADKGEVIVQTYAPENDAVRLAAAHDYETFAERELAARIALALPPAARMARVTCRDAAQKKAEQHAEEVAALLRGVAAGGVRVEGPAESPIARIAGQWRVAVDMYAPGAGSLRATLGAARAKGAFRSDARTAVDVDPIALL